MTYESWIMVAVMLLVVLLMFLGKVREFYTPAYLDKIPIKDWLLYIVYKGPLKKPMPTPLDTSSVPESS